MTEKDVYQNPPLVKNLDSFYALLAKYGARPSLPGEEWARDNWTNLQSVTGRVISIHNEARLWSGKGKAIICAVLGACLVAAIEDRSKRRSHEKQIIESLENLAQLLQKTISNLEEQLAEKEEQLAKKEKVICLLKQQIEEKEEIEEENHLLKDALKERGWKGSEGLLWTLGTPQLNIGLPQTAPPLPLNKVTNVKQYPLPLGTKEGIKPVMQEIQEQGVVINTHSPFNSPVCPVKKPKEKRKLTVDFRRLNADTDPLTATVLNMAELVITIQEKAHPIMATIDAKDMFFMIPL